MLTLCIPVVLVAFLAALGHSATPRAERTPWTRWIPVGLARNTVRGARRLVELDERSPLATYRHAPSQPAPLRQPMATRGASPAAAAVEGVESLFPAVPETAPAQPTS